MTYPLYSTPGLPGPRAVSGPPPVVAPNYSSAYPSLNYAQNFTWMPVIRAVPPQAPQAGDTVSLSPPPEEASGLTAPANGSPGQLAPDPWSQQVLPDQAAQAPSAEGGEVRQPDNLETPPASPQTYAEETGEKIGQFVTRLIEGNPQLESRLKDMRLDNMLEDPHSALNQLKASLQDSRLVRTLLRFDKRLVASLPAEYEPMAREFFDWLKSDLSPVAGLDPAPQGRKARTSEPEDNLDEILSGL